MPHSTYLPIDLYRITIGWPPCRNHIGVPTRRLTGRHCGWFIDACNVLTTRSKTVCLHPLLDHLSAINGGSYPIIRAMKNDSGHHARGCTHHTMRQFSLVQRLRPTISHRLQPGEYIFCSPIFYSRMHPYGCNEIGVRRSHDVRHSTSS